jgi:hypothetical protein
MESSDNIRLKSGRKRLGTSRAVRSAARFATGRLCYARSRSMEILTLPVGLVVGLFPVFVDLGPQGGAATLLLDGRPACALSAAAPGCMVDLGALPRIHTLGLRRTDEHGRVVEEIQRYLNRGFIGVVRALGSCDDERRTCDFQIQWGHPGRLAPTEISARVDGKPARIVGSRILFANPPAAPPQVLTLEATFPDGGRAEFTRLLHGSFPEETEARLTAVPIEAEIPIAPSELERSLRSAGWPLRAVEQGPAEVLFAVEPGAFRSLAPGRGTPAVSSHPGSRRAARGALEGADRIRFLSAGESLQSITFKTRSGGATDWVRAIESIGRTSSAVRIRVADAVAAGAFALNASAHRRIVVLVLASGNTESASRSLDASTFTRDGALAYLRDAGVPLVVWRAGGGGPAWPDETRIESEDDLARAAARVRERLDRQWTAWLEAGASELALPALPEGIARAGGERTSPASASSPSNVPGDGSSPVDVYDLSEDAAAKVVFAAAGEGLFQSGDDGGSWSRRATPGPRGTPVLSVAAGVGPDRIVLAGTPRALWRVSASAASTVSLPGVQALALRGPAGSSLLFATARGQLCATDDGGRVWRCEGGLSSAYAASISVDPGDPRLAYAGTMGSGVFSSRDGGRVWSPFGSALQNTAIRAVVRDPTAHRVYAATDGGLFVSEDGAQWKPLASFPRTIAYAVALDPRDANRIFAGTEEGLFESVDGGATWAARPLEGRNPVVTSLLAARGRLYAGTLGAGVVTFDLAAK